MNLLTYLTQANRTRNGLQPGVSGPVRVQHHEIGPCDVVAWANENKGEFSRGDKNTELLVQMFESFSRTNNLTRGFRLRFVPTGNYADPYGSPAALAEALWDCDESEPALHWLEDVRQAVRAIVGFGIGMGTWPWAACRHYHTISSIEAKAGYTNDFAAKHLNTNEDIRGARRVAEIRGAPVAQRQGIQAFGNIVTARSGGILKGAVAGFAKEIQSRQKEFSDTHAGLCDHFRETYDRYGGTAKAKFQYIDSVTFVTLKTYGMHEFENGKGSESELYIRFSVSCDAAGKEWAAHHLDSTAQARTARGGTLLSALGIPGVDATTSAKVA